MLIADTPRRYIMCPPAFFAVVYRINPWMRPGGAVDASLAMAQWQTVVDTYQRLGHEVICADAIDGLPDLVFTANAGLVREGRVLLSRFRHEERAGEEAVMRRWFEQQGLMVNQATCTNEGEGDYLTTDAGVLGAVGFRTDPLAHPEVEAFFERPVIGLRLVDPRLYHLDTALAVLDPATIAYHPAAFDPASRGILARVFPDAIVASEADALGFGLNACSDGHHVVMSAGAPRLAEQIAARGFEPIPVDTSELQKSGGSVKCCTLEVHQ